MPTVHSKMAAQTWTAEEVRIVFMILCRGSIVYLIKLIMFVTLGCDLDKRHRAIREGQLGTDCPPAAGPHEGSMSEALGVHSRP
jgi:hypothetical protein